MDANGTSGPRVRHPKSLAMVVMLVGIVKLFCLSHLGNSSISNPGWQMLVTFNIFNKVHALPGSCGAGCGSAGAGAEAETAAEAGATKTICRQDMGDSPWMAEPKIASHFSSFFKKTIRYTLGDENFGPWPQVTRILGIKTIKMQTHQLPAASSKRNPQKIRRHLCTSSRDLTKLPRLHRHLKKAW